ncbi:unnamed protein product [Peniophora sp. CBMAI 1063]|nr:unnamed protein product [Peniophora sp. CBMAI 1063]
MPASLFSLPPELIEHLISFFTGAEIAAFAGTNRALHELIAEDNTHLWRALYLAQPYDDPLELGLIDDVADFSWAATYKIRYTAENSKSQVRPVVDGIIHTVRTAPRYSAHSSADMTWATQLILRNAHMFRDFGEDAVARALSDTDRETEDRRLRVRAHFPLSLTSPLREVFNKQRQAARTYIYDMRNYTKDRQYGPFKDDFEDAVNWEHVDKIVTVVAANLRDFGATWPQPLQPPLLVHGAEALREGSVDMFRNDDEEVESNPLDWAGVEGEWMRVVCFCDYRDLFQFNAGSRNQDFFDEDFEEATRLLRMHMHVTDIDESIPSADPKRPTLRIVGSMRGLSAMEHSDRTVRGYVTVMPGGDIRWSFQVSIHHGEEQWSSEAVQLGGAASAAGLVGIWTGAHHNHGDPAGPFWAFKVNEDVFGKDGMGPLGRLYL